jgi:hypothetical protein
MATESNLGGEETRRAIARYGFDYRATSRLQHADFLSEMAVLCLEDAYEFAREHGEDWADVLFPCERDVAGDGVYSPRSYWERRPRLAEHECEEAIASYRADRTGDGPMVVVLAAVVLAALLVPALVVTFASSLGAGVALVLAVLAVAGGGFSDRRRR